MGVSLRMDLKDRLRHFHQRHHQGGSLPENKERGTPLTQLIKGREEKTPEGLFFLRELSLPVQEPCRGFMLSDWEEIEGSLLSLVARDEKLASSSSEDLLFIDTETTGLSGGAGTLAFMVGIGYFSKKMFHVQQLLIRDYYEEPALLAYLQQLLQEREGGVLVSFNGKSYDLPLLKTRFTLNRLSFPWSEGLHFDLLHAARRLWKHRLESCSLNNLERQILGSNRSDDLEGFLIPELFFQYLAAGEGRILLPIFKHNLLDLLGMAALTLKMVEHLREAPALEEATDLLSLAKLLEELGYRARGEGCYLAALEKDLPPSSRIRALKRLSLLYKREGDYPNACRLWEELLEERAAGLFPYRELAKYHEHHSRRLELARDYTLRAQSFLQENRALYPSYKRKKENQALKKRYRRLERRLS